MPIVFHCEHCGQKISAPDSAGGHAGKCPKCQQRVFIPAPSDQLEEIPLAPEDPKEEKARRQNLAEQFKIMEELEKHKDLPPETPTSKSKGIIQNDSDMIPFASGHGSKSDNLEMLIHQYLICMSRGNLNEAEDFARDIAEFGKSGAKKVEDMAMQEMIVPELASVPPNVMAGFFKKLLVKFPK